MGVTYFYLVLGAVLFGLGALGVLIRRNAIVMLMCVELMLSAVNITVVALSREQGVLTGQVYVMLVMAVAAAEAVIGLAIVLTVFRNYHSVYVNNVCDLRG